MASGSTHRIITTTDGSTERWLVLEIRSWKFAFAVFDGTNLLDWGVCRFPAGGTPAAIRRLTFFLKAYTPSQVITRCVRRAKHVSSKRAVRLLRGIRDELERRSVPLAVIARRDIREFFARRGCRNKMEVAALIADRFRPLKPRVPRSRKPWDPERNIVAVFDAIATAIAFDGIQEATAGT